MLAQSTMLKILTVPNKLLNHSAKPLNSIDSRIEKFVSQMEKTLIDQKDPPGVGLAANQVGQSLAIFIIKPTSTSKTEIFINPKIIDSVKDTAKYSNKSKSAKSKGSNSSLEGCLSVPKIWAPVKRPKKVLVEYQNLTGKKYKKWFGGFKAVIIQHEIDHLQGVLFTQRAVETGTQLYEEHGDKLEKLTSRI